MLWCICSLRLFSLTPFLTFEAVLFPQVEICENAMCCSSEMACNNSGHILPLSRMLAGRLLVKGAERTAIVNSCLRCIPLWLDKAGSACLITGQASACYLFSLHLLSSPRSNISASKMKRGADNGMHGAKKKKRKERERPRKTPPLPAILFLTPLRP